MDDSIAHLHQQAITAALSSDWKLSVKLNKEILKEDCINVGALNRLARSHFELGDLKLAKSFYTQALKIDPYNAIATKFLKRIEACNKKTFKGSPLPSLDNPCVPINNNLFIEEPGRTKMVTLLKLAEPHKLSLLSAGTPVRLILKNRGIGVTDIQGEYLGILPDDISHHLAKLIKGGNRYQSFIKSIKLKSLSIIIREEFRAARFKNQPSFLDNTNGLTTYSSEHIIVPDMEEETTPDETEEETV